jgi:hypothetical protein
MAASFPSLRQPSAFVIAKAGVQLRQPIVKHRNIFGIRGLQLPKTVLVDVRDLAGLYRLQELNEAISFLMPVLGAHFSRHSWRSSIGWIRRRVDAER